MSPRAFIQGARLLRLGALVAAVVAGVAPARADRIVLKNGRVIEAERAWVEGQQVRYEKNGGRYGLPLELVQSLDQREAPLPTSDPDVARARTLLAAGQPAEAVRLLQQAVSRDPGQPAAQQELAAAQVQLGNGHAARQAASAALKLDDRNPRNHELLGDALALLGDRAGAEAALRRSLLLRPDPRVQAKLAAVGERLPAPIVSVPLEPLGHDVPILPAAPAPRPPVELPLRGGARLRLRFDGGINEPLGGAVLAAADAIHGEYTRRFSMSPDESVTIVLQTEAAFEEGGAPPWAAGLNDGTIRLPVQGLSEVSPALLRVLRHELAHSFVSARTGGNCPVWIQEGIAQWLEGGDPIRGDAALAASSRSGRLLPLLSLEGPFQSLSERDARQAYAQSLSAIAFVLSRRGESGLMRLLAALGDGLPSEEALPVAFALSYPEFQREWELGLKGNLATR